MSDTLEVPKTVTEAQADVLGVPAAFYAKLVQHAAMLATPQTFGVALGTICAGDVRFNASRPEERAREGWRLVPTEATAEMIQAAEDRQIEGANYIAESSIQFALWREVWRAMLKAAPPMNSGRDK